MLAGGLSSVERRDVVEARATSEGRTSGQEKIERKRMKKWWRSSAPGSVRGDRHAGEDGRALPAGVAVSWLKR